MDVPIKEIVEYGVLGATTGLMFWLFLRERKISQKMQEQHVARLAADNKHRVGYTLAIERLNQTVRVLGEEAKAQTSTCRLRSQHVEEIVENFVRELELKRAREEGQQKGREEVTGKITLPPGGIK